MLGTRLRICYFRNNLFRYFYYPITLSSKYCFQLNVNKSAFNINRVFSNRLFIGRREITDVTPDLDFEKICNETLDSLSDFFENLIESHIDLRSTDVTYSDGVLTLILGEKGTYVLNRQTPNKQIWLSSPISGPKRYDLIDKKQWIYRHDNVSLHSLLQNELSELLNIRVDLSKCSYCGHLQQKDVRDCYSRLQQVNKELMRVYALRCANHDDLLKTLKNINSIIQHASRLRVGKFKGEIAGLCRSALANRNVNALIRIVKTGET